MCIKEQPRNKDNLQVFLLGYKLQGMILHDIVIIIKSVLRNFQNITFNKIKCQKLVRGPFCKVINIMII